MATVPRTERDRHVALTADVDWAGVGLRRTPQREVILALVRSASEHPEVEHPTAEWVHRRAREFVPDISLATVYRTLRILKEKGLIYEFSGGVGPSRYDGTRHEHEHVRCICCGTVVDVNLPEISEIRQIVATRSGFVIGTAPMLFQGVCAECHRQHKTPGILPLPLPPAPQRAPEEEERDLAEGAW